MDVDVTGLRLRLPRSGDQDEDLALGRAPRVARAGDRGHCPLEAFPSVVSSRATRIGRSAGDDPRLSGREDPHYSPHDLRHRRITLWHQSGAPARELAERAGHSRPSMSLDVYTHVMPVEEVAVERFAAVLV